MRQNQQNKQRMRGRPNRKAPNPLTRSFDSNGPDIKIRGTALHIAEKYTQLARDASSAGDRVMAENYLQHAEHYYRIIAAAQGEQSDSAEKYLRTGEAAAALECHPRSVFRYAARGLLHPVRRSARAIRWRKSEVERLAGGVAQ